MSILVVGGGGGVERGEVGVEGRWEEGGEVGGWTTGLGRRSSERIFRMGLMGSGNQAVLPMSHGRYPNWTSTMVGCRLQSETASYNSIGKDSEL